MPTDRIFTCLCDTTLGPILTAWQHPHLDLSHIDRGELARIHFCLAGGRGAPPGGRGLPAVPRELHAQEIRASAMIANQRPPWFDNPRDLIATIRRIVHVSVATVRIVKGLPDPFGLAKGTERG